MGRAAGGRTTPRRRRRDRTEQRLTAIQDELKQLARDRQVLTDQLVHLRATADDASVQAAVRPSRPERREAEAAARDVTNHQLDELDELDGRRRGLEEERDQLLDDLLETEDDG